MPRFDSSGRLISGVGSGVVAIDGRRIADGGVACWLADGVAIYQNSTDDCLYEHSVSGEPRLVSVNGANAIAAGGGQWIAWLGFVGLYGPNGLIDPHGRLAGTSQEQDGRGAASPDGHIAITDSENRGFLVVAPDGRVTLEVRATIALSMHLIDGQTAIWVDEHRRPRGVGRPAPAVPAFDLFAIRAVRVGDDWFVLAGTHTGLVLYPWRDATQGWRLDGLAFYPTAFVEGSLVRIAYARGAGERPEDLDEWRVDVASQPKVPLSATPSQPPTQPPTPEPPMPDIPNQTDVVTRVRAKYPTPLGAQHAQCLLEIAREIGQQAGLLRKDSGTNIVLPDGTRVAQDIICFPDGRIYDCLGDAEGEASPGWSEANGSPVDPARYYRVSTTPEPGPTPDPPPNGDTLSEVLYELRRLSYHLGVRP